MAVTINGSSGLTTNDGSVFTDASGNVGIGTGSPTAKLDIASTNASGAFGLRISDTTNSLNAQLLRTSASYSYAGVGGLETWLYSQGTSNLTLGPDGAGSVKFVTNGFERMRIDSSGRVTMPAQPGFKATSTSNNDVVPSPAGDTGLLSTRFDKVTEYSNYNTGSHYNTSTGRFTAPVAGVYFVFANIRWETQDFIQNSYIRLFASVNGSTVGYRSGVHQINGSNEAWQNYMAMTISGTLLLSAGDYIELRGGLSGGTASAYWNESGWGAYLLG